MNGLHAMKTIEFVSLSNSKVLRYAQKYAWNTNDDQINVARRNLSADADVSRTFFDAPPLRFLDSMKETKT